MERHQGKNLGSVKQILIIALGDITIPSGRILLFNQIAIAQGKGWTTVPFTLETGSCTDFRKNSKAGDFYEKEVIFSIPAIRNEISEEIALFSGKRVAALVTDMNDHTRLFYPLRMEYAAEVPPEVAGYNGYRITLRGSSAFESPSVTMPS